jgi:hypothetical protein
MLVAIGLFFANPNLTLRNWPILLLVILGVYIANFEREADDGHS